VLFCNAPRGNHVSTVTVVTSAVATTLVIVLLLLSMLLLLLLVEYDSSDAERGNAHDYNAIETIEFAQKLSIVTKPVVTSTDDISSISLTSKSKGWYSFERRFQLAMRSTLVISGKDEKKVDLRRFDHFAWWQLHVDGITSTRVTLKSLCNR
jgi:hypothetical protein